MRYLVRIIPLTETKESFLSAVRSLAKSAGSDARNPKWTSYGALEIDIFANSDSDFQLFLSVLSPLGKIEFSKDLNKAPAHQTVDETFAEAVLYFNSERYWECHEVLEGYWRAIDGEEKKYVQGLILVCAALVHHQKGEEKVALSVLSRASRQLDYPSKVYHGFDVISMKRNVNRLLVSGRVEEFRA